MRFVHIQERIELFLDFTQLLEVCCIAIHTENGFRNDKYIIVFFPMCHQQGMQVLVIQVAVTEHLRLAEADAVNDACMNELVGDNQSRLAVKAGNIPILAWYPELKTSAAGFSYSSTRSFSNSP